ncbi:hypothetical protein HK101_008572 [Irineochytrium annulatum]|nr:hypothetical protein HK101_008572 [Irineochytrium annulatum]
MNIDTLFKVPTGPANLGGKRKLPDEPTTNTLKKMRGRDDADEDTPASEIKWGVGVEYDARQEKARKRKEAEEEDSRFHGDGLSEKQREIMEIVDAGEETAAIIDLKAMKRLILRFEQAIAKNSEMRVKHANEPVKFIESEADLDEEIHAMMRCSASPHLYPSLVQLGTVDSILSLLAHENTDIAIAAIALLNELTDEDVVADVEEDGAEGMKALVKALLENEALELLVSNLERMNEDSTEADDKQGVFNALGVVENLISVDPTVAELVVSKTPLLPWLAKRVKVKTFDSNRQYASELLAILLQTSRANRLALNAIDGFTALMQVIASFKRKDPKDGDEVEMMENVFDALCLGLAEPEVKAKFLEEEGIELMLIVIREKKMARMRALKVLDHALTGESGKACCTKFVEGAGLKAIFPIFMKKGLKAYRKEYKSHSESEEDEHIASILSSLLKNTSEPAQFLRIVNKFFEGDFEKLNRLIELHDQYRAKVANADRQFDVDSMAWRDEDDDDGIDSEEERYLNRLDKGLFTLQLVDLVIGILAVQDAEPAVQYVQNMGDTEGGVDKQNLGELVERLDALDGEADP